jgi:rare lipoprotein A
MTSSQTRPGAAVAMRAAAAILLVLMAAACSQAPRVATAPQTAPTDTAEPGRGVYKVGEPYRINGVWYYPAENYGYAETGIASFYGGERTGIDFHGRTTANGEAYDMNALTAAHQTLPMPSLVRVTNLDNGRQLVLRVNDRGPFVGNRILDVSRRSAQLLGFEQRGTAPVRVEILADESRRMKLAMLNRMPASIETVAAAPRGSVSAEPLPPPAGARSTAPTAAAAPMPLPSATLPPATARGGARGGAALEMASAQVASLPPEAQARAVPTLVQVPVRPTTIWVQAGAFASQDNAAKLGAQLRRFGATQISEVRSGDQRLFRLRVGPARSVADADRLLADVAGVVPDARIVVD